MSKVPCLLQQAQMTPDAVAAAAETAAAAAVGAAAAGLTAVENDSGACSATSVAHAGMG